jgi:hypothetical protein
MEGEENYQSDITDIVFNIDYIEKYYIVQRHQFRSVRLQWMHLPP